MHESNSLNLAQLEGVQDQFRGLRGVWYSRGLRGFDMPWEFMKPSVSSAATLRDARCPDTHSRPRVGPAMGVRKLLVRSGVKVEIGTGAPTKVSKGVAMETFNLGWRIQPVGDQQ